MLGLPRGSALREVSERNSGEIVGSTVALLQGERSLTLLSPIWSGILTQLMNILGD